MHLHDLTIKNFHEGLQKKEFSALEMTQEFFKFIHVRDKEIGAYLTLLEEDALKTAGGVDAAVAKGDELPLLAGVPIALKDNMLVEGTQVTAGSKILGTYRASYDAGVVKKLKTSHAVILGKTNLDEFAMGSSTENSAFQLTKNPHDLSRVPGGSSGGSAAAVASHMAVAALGSDTGGSIRQPAALCGVVGFKPTYGAVSRHGLIAMASSLDQIGPFAKTVEDAAMLFNAIRGRDAYDATSVSDYDFVFPKKLEDIKDLRIGIPEEYLAGGMDASAEKAFQEAITKLKTLGIQFKQIRLPHTKYALSVYYIIMPAEVSANLARLDGVRYARVPDIEKHIERLRDVYFKDRGVGFGEETKRRLLLGTFVLSSGYYDAYYAKAQKVRHLIQEDFNKAFEEVDMIIAPTTPTPAFVLGEKTADPVQMYLSDIFTIPVNLAGLPAVSLPVKKYVLGSGELPLGFQLIGKHFAENDILSLGHFYEKIL